jgi:hypothetical protein
MKAQTESRSIVTTLSLTSTVDGGGWLTPLPSHLTPDNDLVVIVQEAGCASGPVWTGAEMRNLTGSWSSDLSKKYQM